MRHLEVIMEKKLLECEKLLHDCAHKGEPPPSIIDMVDAKITAGLRKPSPGIIDMVDAKITAGLYKLGSHIADKVYAEFASVDRVRKMIEARLEKFEAEKTKKLHVIDEEPPVRRATVTTTTTTDGAASAVA